MTRTFTIYLPSNFQVYSAVLLIIVTMLHIRSLEIFHLRTGSFYPLTCISPFPPSWLPQVCPLFLWLQLFYIPHKSATTQHLSFSSRPSSFSLSLGNIMWTCSFNYHLYAYEYQLYMFSSDLLHSRPTLLSSTWTLHLLISKEPPTYPFKKDITDFP